MADDLLRLERLRAISGDPENPSADELREIMRYVRTIAVVGASRDPMKAARRVPSYMAAKGYETIGINPHAERMWGRPAYSSLEDYRAPVDLVVVFRPSAEASRVARVALGRAEGPTIWLQEGIFAPDEAREARDRGTLFVQDLCLYKVHRALDENAPGYR